MGVPVHPGPYDHVRPASHGRMYRILSKKEGERRIRGVCWNTPDYITRINIFHADLHCGPFEEADDLYPKKQADIFEAYVAGGIPIAHIFSADPDLPPLQPL